MRARPGRLTRRYAELEQVELAVPQAEVRYDSVIGFHALSNLPVQVTQKTATKAAG